MATIRFALEWPRQDLEHIWRALLATSSVRLSASNEERAALFVKVPALIC